MATENVILPESEEAASIQTVTGWVSRIGHFFGNGPQAEDMARYNGSTHRKCDCGEIIERNGYCRPCHNRKEKEKFDKMERREWNGTDALYSNSHDRYFFDHGELIDYCEDEEITPDDLDLIICVPTYAQGIDPVEHYYDDLPEDRDEVPAAVQAAFDELNARLKEEKIILSWFPGKYRAIIDMERNGNTNANNG